MKLKEWFREWDEGNIDLTDVTMRDSHREASVEESVEEKIETQPVERFSRAEKKAFRTFYPALIALLSMALIAIFIVVIKEMPPFGVADTPANTSDVIRRYIENGLTETGAVNIVAGVILDYRAFDTLGESHVLFTATIAVFILMLMNSGSHEEIAQRNILQKDSILYYTSRIIIPLVLMFGVYIILNGHLGPGGGFSGGAVIGGGLILYDLSNGETRLHKILNMKSYRIIVLAALLFYGLSKCYSFFCGANGLHTIFTTGIPGAILSAGLILPLNIAVGIVVACTMYGFYAIFTRGRI